jgi:hypothetical protein
MKTKPTGTPQIALVIQHHIVCMKSKLPTILMALLAALFTATVARADDAELKKQLVGTWNDKEIGLVTVLKANGTLVSGGVQEKWDVKDGHFIELGTTHGDLTFTIVSVTRHKFVFRDDAHQHGTGVWTRD